MYGYKYISSQGTVQLAKFQSFVHPAVKPALEGQGHPQVQDQGGPSPATTPLP